jgi:hypothetical protein
VCQYSRVSTCTWCIRSICNQGIPFHVTYPIQNQGCFRSVWTIQILRRSPNYMAPAWTKIVLSCAPVGSTVVCRIQSVCSISPQSSCPPAHNRPYREWLVAVFAWVLWYPMGNLKQYIGQNIIHVAIIIDSVYSYIYSNLYNHKRICKVNVRSHETLDWWNTGPTHL